MDGTMFCNHCGAAVSNNVTICVSCGAALPQVVSEHSVSQQSTSEQIRRKVIRARLIVAVIIRCIVGIVWDVLAAVVLFHPDYSVFESDVVCLLVMILCVVATLFSDLEPWRMPDRKESDGKVEDSGRVDKVSRLLRSAFYGMAFVMALVKLAMAIV